MGGVGQTSQLDAGAAARLPFVRAVGFLGTVMVQIISRIPPTSSDSLMTIPPPVIGIQNEAQHVLPEGLSRAMFEGTEPSAQMWRSFGIYRAQVSGARFRVLAGSGSWPLPDVGKA